MGGLVSSNYKEQEQLRYILSEFQVHLKTLTTTSDLLKKTIDTQHSSLQKYFDDTKEKPEGNDEDCGKEERLAKAGAGSNINEWDLKALASMQDSFCIQACDISNTAANLSRLLSEGQKHFKFDFDNLPERHEFKGINTGKESRVYKFDQMSANEEAIYNLQQEKRTLEDDLNNEKGKNEKMRNSMRELQLENRKLKSKIDELKSYAVKPYKTSSNQRKVSAFLYTPRKGDLLEKVTIELSGMLKNQFATQNTDLHLTDCKTVQDIPTDRPVIVICINASRLGTDVSGALQGLDYNPQIAVVILHHKEMHALPNQASERILTSSEYKALGGMFDMAFLAQRGLYTCDLNNKSLNGLMDFINQRNA